MFASPRMHIRSDFNRAYKENIENRVEGLQGETGCLFMEAACFLFYVFRQILRYFGQ